MATCSRLTRPEGLTPSKGQLDGHQHGFRAGTGTRASTRAMTLLPPASRSSARRRRAAR